MRRRHLLLSHYHLLAGHSGQRRMYDTMRRDYYWPHMANDVAEIINQCQSCARNRGHVKLQRQLQLFPASGPLEFVALDILGPLPKTKKENLYVVVMTDRYSKLTRDIPTSSITTTAVKYIFSEHWINPHGIPAFVLTDNGTLLVSKFFATLCTHLGLKQLTTTAYHPQTNGQVERYKKTLDTQLRHYVAYHQNDWDAYVQPLTYAYSLQVHK